MESASEYRPVFFERNKRFSVSFMTLRHFGLSLIKIKHNGKVSCKFINMLNVSSYTIVVQ